jgi:hypothetical protein
LIPIFNQEVVDFHADLVKMFILDINALAAATFAGFEHTGYCPENTLLPTSEMFKSTNHVYGSWTRLAYNSGEIF